MADLATQLIRTVVRAFYPGNVDCVLVIDCLCLHSTLSDADMAFVLGMQTKSLRRVVGRLKEDGLVSVHSRGEKKEGAPAINSQPGSFKERVFYRDWYYINYHRALDCIKYKLWRLSRHIESMGAPTAEKKDLQCGRCKSEYTELEALDSLSPTGEFLCHKCGQALDPVEVDTVGENEAMRRMNNNLSDIVNLMRKLDATTITEHDFDEALAHQVPVARGEYAPARQMIHVEDTKAGLESSKGLKLEKEKIIANVLGDDDVDKVDANEVLRRKEAESKANALPSWITHSSVSGDITRVGAKEQAERAARDVHLHDAGTKTDEPAEKEKKGQEDLLDDYFKALKAEEERKALEEAEGSSEDEDDFEDVDINVVNPPAVATPATTGVVSSSATDDEDARAGKRVKFESSQSNRNGPEPSAAKDVVSDEDELEFEDV